jgi:hypothetical protein
VLPGGRHDIAAAHREIGASLKLFGERVPGACEYALPAHVEDPSGDARNDRHTVAGITPVVDDTD